MMNVSYADRGNVMHHYKLFGLVLSGIGLLTGSAAASLAPTPSTAPAQSQWSPVVVLHDDVFDVNGESLATTSGGPHRGELGSPQGRPLRRLLRRP